MGSISSLFARKVITAAGDSVDRDALLSSVGLEPSSQTDVAHMISDEVYYDLLERILEQMEHGHELPVRVGPLMLCDNYGALGLAWKAALTLRQSFERVVSYARLWTSVAEYELRPEGQNAYFILHRVGERRLGLRVSNECTLASATSIVRQVSPVQFSPLEVHCKHAGPENKAAHEAYFGCPVIWNSELDALLVSEDDLNRPNLLGDAGITQFLITHLDQEIEKYAAEDTFPDDVRNVIARALSSGVPKASATARQLGISERTLQRRLKSGGLTFQTIVENARSDLARGLLVQSDYSLAEIAFLTGFSEQSAFSRAFKRWSSHTPAKFREKHKPV
ncbi:MAG: AraC family transcriptional regulator [Rhodospirillaceae bacterium]